MFLKKIFEAIKNSPLFDGFAFSDFEKMSVCLSARQVTYRKGETILFPGEDVSSVGLVFSGSAKIIREDSDGHISILAELAVSDIFGEVLAFAGVSKSPVTVKASGETGVLFIDCQKIITTCTSACVFHAKLIRNMLGLIARKNLLLNRKIEILSKRTTLEKLLCFLDAHRGEEATFTISFNREELAQYLCVDRSALSNELSKMRRAGLIDFQKNTFTIL